MDAMRDPR